jgi:hypothetical protein
LGDPLQAAVARFGVESKVKGAPADLLAGPIPSCRILIVVQQAVADPAHAAAYELDVERLGHKFADTLMGAAVDSSVLSSLISGFCKIGL